MEEVVTIGKPDPNSKALANAESAVSAHSKNSESNVKGERESQEKSMKGLGANRTLNKTDLVEEYNQKILKFAEKGKEPPLEDGELQANFLDDAFGENCVIDGYKDGALLALRREEQRMNR